MPTDIDWADETLNPLGWGCYGPGGTKEKPNICPYCYAYRQAKRGLSKCDLCNKFIPHAHMERLTQLQKWTEPRNIFIQSMGDLFGDWVPDECIQQVFAACEKAPQHRYLFLTKNPERYSALDKLNLLPIQHWYGTTATKPEGKIFAGRRYNSFVSIEPIHAKFETIGDQILHRACNWYVVGAETGNRKEKVVPKFEWIDSIAEQCCKANVPVFMKSNLRDVWGPDLIQMYPWEEKG